MMFSIFTHMLERLFLVDNLDFSEVCFTWEIAKPEHASI
jgi:hypothetical protein